ncbi:ATP-grasp domain-containing protein [Actinoplanes sp. NPDC049548]|uniref:ATP-grasp domain-containing protein n=1 Tax=Actinoplanes sp. NPDC049548 TaxID=3155152 RepID=UPI00344843ED
MSHPRPVVVLVDAYTSGKYLLPEFTALGAEVVHVQSTSELMASMPEPDLSGYAARIVHDDLAKTVEQLLPYAPVRVLAGQEPGVLLADALSRELGLPMNDPGRSEARRDKYEMIEALRDAGLHCADQFTSGDVEGIVDWLRQGRGFPVVVKPRRSAAGDSVFICAGEAQVRAAVEAVLGSETIYGETNPQVLVQSFLPGTEYVVDMVTHGGRRYVCGVWEYSKRLLPSGRNIYDRERLLDPGEAPVPELTAYVDRALDALGVRFGPTHAEVILTPEGPALVEVGCRIAGNMHPGFHDHCAGANQATLSALEVLRPRDFLERYAGRHYDKRYEAVCCTTSTTLDGVVDHIDEQVVAEIAGLDSVYRFDLKIAPGGRIRPTVDLYSSTMRVFMSAGTMPDIDRDYGRIEQLKDRVYRLRAEVGAR